ncbi:uncharacterized protein LOC105430553 [Pogonomyrmex barbatus]|uniref:Uncharacterized protein LOC105430553 n=1 Tax=Pogonomyrmex barbatus TaxID=144034 RepID=A0A6I9XC55_9HYME|nr:uncharacterized protein LOC105430553 [Pogonomyrmex barbatus]
MGLTSKQLQRLEKKKAKMAALLEITRLNDRDKEAKLQVLKQTIVGTDEFNNPNININIPEDNSNRKRSCEKGLDDICSEPKKGDKIPIESELQDNSKKPSTIEGNHLVLGYGSLETALQMNGNVIRLLRSVFPMHSSSDVKCTKDSTLPTTDKFCRTKLLLSLWQMVEENYPVPLKGTLADRYNSYILTKDVYEEATSTSPMFSLDCEMCLTTTGNLELTRISIVDESMNVIYDSLVKPKNTITNYLTQYSGITEAMLHDVTVTLHDVQQTLRTLLPPDAILVGQSLNSDLHTLKMMHPYIIDTSVIFNLTGDRYRKTKLQILAREFLGESIQNDKNGHCSTEDSKASMKLVKLKLANSVDYGDAVLLGDRSIKVLKMEMTRDKTKQASKKTEIKKYATSIFNHITKNKGTAAIIGSNEVMSEYSKYLTNSSLNIMDDENFAKDDQVRLVIANDDVHAVDRTAEIVMEHAFVLCHVKVKEEQLKDEHIEETFHTVNKWIHKVWQYSAINSLACVIFGGQNNSANGTCFLNIKTEISPNIVIRA